MRDRPNCVRWTARVCAWLVLGIGLVLWTPGIAEAHAALVSSQPEAGSELGTAPGVVVLRFSEPLNVKLSRATVVAPDGARYQGSPGADESITITLSTNAQGVYSVEWTTVSTLDGHTLSGSFRFGVGVAPGAGSEGVVADEPSPYDLGLSLARAIEDLALLLAIGMLVVGRVARREPRAEWVRLRLRPVVAVALVAGTVVVVGDAIRAAPTPSLGSVITYLTTGVPGVARLGRILFEGAALASAIWVPGIAALPLAAAIVGLAAAGHADAIRPSWWGVGVESVHLLAAGIWAGGILALATQRPEGGWRGQNGRAVLDRFTPVALPAFVVTVGTGGIRGVQEVGSLRELFTTGYGVVLLAKILAVLVMAQLSVLAWRRVIGSLRWEAAVAACAVAAAALLAAFPLPPARVAEAERAAESVAGESALPRQGALTLGGRAGQVLLGLTVRPATPGPNDVLIYVLPLEGESEASPLEAQLSVDGDAVPLSQCGPTCRSARTTLQSESQVEVRISGPTGGAARFQLPTLPAPPGDGILARMMSTMHALHSYRLDESLTSGLGTTVNARYAFVAPDRFQSEVEQPSSHGETVWIGSTRYLRQNGGKWQVERGGPKQKVPQFIWDFFRPFVDARVLGSSTVDGTRTKVVAFFGDSGSTPVWFRLWIDSTGLVHKAEMRAQGHFMDHRYYDFDAPIVIRPPVAQEG